MLNYEIAPEILLPYVPRGTELESYRGHTYISLVGFLFSNTRIWGVPLPLHSAFEEVNLRFYVTRKHPEGIRRGVVFVKELVPSHMIAFAARTLYNENYQRVPMRNELEMVGETGYSRVRYCWEYENTEMVVGADVDEPAFLPKSESVEAFVAEHYWGYSSLRDGNTLEYRVDHPPWKIRRACKSVCRCDVDQLYGPEFAAHISERSPHSAFIAEGSEVNIRLSQTTRV